MCTISWAFDSAGYRVYFNRDEQKTRVIAEPPRVFDFTETRVIMPIDPQGQGTWCAVNDSGLCFALLNYYQGRLPKGRLISRGQIVKTCAQFTSFNDAQYYLHSLNLAKYAPFSLVCFSMEDARPRMQLLRWTGKKFLSIDHASPLVSSAVNFDQVYLSRINIANNLLGASSEHSDMIKLHASHLPSRSSQSICMHREDAQTVSFSFIEVSQSRASYYYTDGAPCVSELGPPTSVAISLNVT